MPPTATTTPANISFLLIVFMIMPLNVCAQ
jgi:hypothetical protein